MFKIAFLFLTLADMYHEGLWKKFFTQEDDFFKRGSIYVHSKNQIKSPFFKKFRIKKQVPTDWAHTMNAQLALVRQALADKNNQWFIFLSESTVPLKDFNTLYRMLMNNTSSLFYHIQNPHLNPGRVGYAPQRHVFGIPNPLQKKHSQWIALNRKHAQILVNRQPLLWNHSVYCDNEHFPGTILASMGLEKEIKKRDLTYYCWTCVPSGSPHPYTFTDLRQPRQLNLLTEAIKKGYFFGRKIAKNCNVSPLHKHLPYMQPKKKQISSFS